MARIDRSALVLHTFYIVKHDYNREEVSDCKRMVSAVLLSEAILFVFSDEYDYGVSLLTDIETYVSVSQMIST